MQTIYTQTQEPILVDDEDYLSLNKYTWSIDHRGYPRAKVNGVVVRMHLLIAKKHDLFRNSHIDHEDQNKANNQKSNFRSATTSQNGANRGLNSNNRCGYKGVWWSFVRQKFQAQITYQRKKIHLGYFDSAIKAAEQYDFAARKFFGKFACCNFEEKSDAATV